eukprot:scaffold9604_cov167-Skeletonema_dohrnii-CCMP3373.AAC.2
MVSNVLNVLVLCATFDPIKGMHDHCNDLCFKSSTTATAIVWRLKTHLLNAVDRYYSYCTRGSYFFDQHIAPAAKLNDDDNNIDIDGDQYY